MIKVCYFTSKDANDIRVFHKECVSLVKAGYDVTMVCPNADDKDVQGVHVRGVKYDEQSDFARFTRLPKSLYEKALEIDADIYHFNDPASIKYGAKLKKAGKKVIFDAFEDHPSLWMNRGTGLKGLFYKTIGYWYKHYEQKQCGKFIAAYAEYGAVSEHFANDRGSLFQINIALVMPVLVINVFEAVTVENANGKFGLRRRV